MPHRTCRLALSAWVLLAAPAFAQQQHDHMPTPLVDLTGNEARVPLTFFGGRPVVEVRVKGKGPYRFYFDTGASGPVLSQKLAKELDMEVIGRAMVKSGGDGPDKAPIAAEMVDMDTVDFGPVKLSNLRAVSMDRIRLGDDKDAPVGVLSPILFRGHLVDQGYLVTIDYPNKELRIRAGALGEPDGKTVFAYQAGRPIPSVMVRVAGQEVEAHLDSGSGGWLSLPNRYAATLPLDGKPTETKRKARSVSGEFAVLEGKLKGVLAFGQFTFDNPPVEFSDVVRTGNLGSKFLERFTVTVDPKNRRFRLEETGSGPAKP